MPANRLRSRCHGRVRWILAAQKQRKDTARQRADALGKFPNRSHELAVDSGREAVRAPRVGATEQNLHQSGYHG